MWFAGDLIKSTHNAIELEKRRLQIYEEVAVKNHEFKTSSHMVGENRVA